MQFVDTHCHIHEASTQTGGDAYVREKWAKGGITSPDELIKEATKSGVNTLICVGCTLKDSEMAVKLAQRQADCYATVGIHPHEAKDHLSDDTKLKIGDLVKNGKKIVAIGEIGLDYFYTHSSKEDQVDILRFQLDLAVKHDLPVIFHVREAYEDFWPIFDEYKGIRGVIHSFSTNVATLDQILSRGLYIGLNGIMTFTQDAQQIEAAKKVPISRLLLETDAPFLTPAPYRGTICQPKHVVETAKFLSELRQETLERVAKTTTSNAKQLFNL